ncbi:3-methyl-2-oxobutanoate hydroxymethyltransferase [Candidatus Woesearchaeota archaeon]|nr:3-methyl-2-oxobutanoate hydroxymethyltransferase [Candidatus Woesearchaeota archaeon]
MPNHKKITAADIIAFKQKKSKITMLTAYDFLTAKIEDEAGIDIILVGDSLGMVVQGHTNTRQVTIEDMIYHTKTVARAVKTALIVGDMPYLTYETPDSALFNARKLISAGADVVKIEGNKPGIVKALKNNGIEVMGHIGLTPQTITSFKLQGKDAESKQRLLQEAQLLEDAGCFSIVLECIPVGLAQQITSQLTIPTIGIGAGAYCDGQVLVIHDLLGLFEAFKPKFVKQYARLAPMIREAISSYRSDVVSGKFPDQEHSYQ